MRIIYKQYSQQLHMRCSKIILSTILCFFSIGLVAQTLYAKSFGNKANPPIIFLHGGPGYNSASFEQSTAQTLADSGFFVLVYDRRGEGRSTKENAAFTFPQTHEDLLTIYKRFGLEKATLIGHSFGGMVGTLFSEKHPDKVEALVLVGAPIELQKSFKTIISSAKQIYMEKGDKSSLGYINLLENMDTTTMPYASYSFMHAMQNGFYSTHTPNGRAQEIYQGFKTDTVLAKYGSKMTHEAPQGFWKNEQYTTMNLAENLKKVTQLKVDVYGMYGKEDGLYAPEQIEDLRAIIGTENVLYLENCSHSVFIDRQATFIKILKVWVP